MLSAIRELRADMLQRPVLIGMIGAGVILGLSGPFDTLRQLHLVPRIIYWVFVACTTFSLGNLIILLVAKLMPLQSNARQMTISIPAMGIAVTALLSVTNAIVFGIWPQTIFDAAQLLFFVTAISAVVTVSLSLLTTAPTAKPPQILARLPLDKRGALIAMTATDHYVDVATAQGNALILMRLADALKEAGIDGLQVHRSHWVALGQVKSARRDAGRAVLTMSNGAEIPVSRSYLPAVKDAGLLPK
jgi:hypothetical protein